MSSVKSVGNTKEKVDGWFGEDTRERQDIDERTITNEMDIGKE